MTPADLTSLVQEMREETRSDAQQPLSAISATGDVNESPVCGNFNAVFQ